MYNFKQNLVTRNRDATTDNKQRQSYPSPYPSHNPLATGPGDSWDLPALSPPGRHHQEKPRPPLSQHHQHQHQLVPVTARADSDDRRSPSSEPGDERLRGLETRLRVAEKSNRALLEEVVRLQSELKAVSRRGEDALREERRARQTLEAALRGSGELVNQLAQRVRQQEDRLTEERGRLDSLAEAGTRKEAQQARISAMERDLEGLEQARSRAERVSEKLGEELRALRSRVEQQQQQQQQQQHQHRARHSSAQEKLESDASDEPPPPPAWSSGLDDLRRHVVDLRSRLRSEADERRRLEQRLDDRLAEAMKSATGTTADPGGGGGMADRLALQARIQEAAEALNQRILEKEVRLREDAARSQAEAERLILREQEARLTQEREGRHQQEARWEALRKLLEDELAGARRAQRAELAEAAETTRGLQEVVQALERRLQELLAREAASAAAAAAAAANNGDQRRTAKEDEEAAAERRQLANRVQDVESRLATSQAALTAEIGALGQRIRAAPAAPDKSQLESLLEDYRRETGRRVAGTEEQLQALKARLERMEERLGGRLSEGNDVAIKELQEKLETISQRLGQTEGHVTDLKSKHSAVNDGVHRNSEQITSLMEDLKLRVGSEIAGRVQDTDSIRMELERLRVSADGVAGGGSGGEDVKRDLAECQALVRKLAEVVQTVKTVTGMKIQSEQKLRVAEMKGVQEEMKQNKTRLDQISAKVGAAGGAAKK